MSVIDTIRAAFDAVGSDPDAGSDVAGAYWCDDCAIRQPVDEDPRTAGADAPTCPECGAAMRFERSPDSGGCAC